MISDFEKRPRRVSVPLGIVLGMASIFWLLSACQFQSSASQLDRLATSTVSVNEPRAIDFDPTQYRPRSMEDVIASVDERLNWDELNQYPNDSIYLEMDSAYTFPTSVMMTYDGEFREILPSRMSAISTWLRAHRPWMADEDVLAIFRYEGRFNDGSAPFWSPVQNMLILSMQEELQPGEKIELYIRWIGLAKMDDKFDYIFLVNAWSGPY